MVYACLALRPFFVRLSHGTVPQRGGGDMGDRRRFREFAAFIARTFPTAVTVADVAGGCGELAFRLHEVGKRTVIIDPRDATFPRWVHRTLRKRAVRMGTLPRLERVPKHAA